MGIGPTIGSKKGPGWLFVYWFLQTTPSNIAALLAFETTAFENTAFY